MNYLTPDCSSAFSDLYKTGDKVTRERLNTEFSYAYFSGKEEKVGDIICFPVYSGHHLVGTFKIIKVGDDLWERVA